MAAVTGAARRTTRPWKRWRHLNFFQHEAFMHAPAPRVKCPSCGIRRARVPWARPRSGFTLLFEALVVTMAAQMPVRAVGRIVGEHDTRLWRIVKNHVDEARVAADHGGVKAVGVDEKACRRGHSCVTFFADLDKRKLLYATPGRKSGVLGEFRGRGTLPRSVAVRGFLPLFVGEVGAVQLVGAQAPARHRPVHDLPKVLVVFRLDEVDHLVDDDVFETRQGLLGQFGVEPDAAVGRVAGAPPRLFMRRMRQSATRTPIRGSHSAMISGMRSWRRARYHRYSMASRASRPVPGRTRPSPSRHCCVGGMPRSPW